MLQPERVSAEVDGRALIARRAGPPALSGDERRSPTAATALLRCRLALGGPGQPAGVRHRQRGSALRPVRFSVARSAFDARTEHATFSGIHRLARYSLRSVMTALVSR